MPRRPRRDAPGLRHHVTNRGQDGRDIYERPRDYRVFQALLACAVRAGRIRLHAYCLMTNHFHLLVESLDGNLSETMRWIESRYAAYFNSTRQPKRKGHLFQARFFSCPVHGWAYFYALVRYIDHNPVRAGLVTDPLLYAYGSARHHCRAGRTPRWLSNTVIDALLGPDAPLGPERREFYRARLGLQRSGARARALIESRLEHPSRTPENLDRLLDATMHELRAWLQLRPAPTAGRRPPSPVADVQSVLDAVAAHGGHLQGTPIPSQPSGRGGLRSIAAAGLLRDCAGLGQPAIAEAMGISSAMARSRYRAYRVALAGDPAFGAAVARMLREALENCLETAVFPLPLRI